MRYSAYGRRTARFSDSETFILAFLASLALLFLVFFAGQRNGISRGFSQGYVAGRQQTIRQVGSMLEQAIAKSKLSQPGCNKSLSIGWMDTPTLKYEKYPALVIATQNSNNLQEFIYYVPRDPKLPAYTKTLPDNEAPTKRNKLLISSKSKGAVP